MHYQSDGIGNSQDPDPAVDGLVPNKQLLNIFIDDDIDRTVDGGVFVDGADRIVYGHGIVCGVVLEDLDDEASEALLN